MKLISLAIAAAGLGAALFVNPSFAEDKSLYQRLGGYDAIAAVTDDFLERLEKNDKLSRFFQGVSTDSLMRLRQHVVDLVCAKTGGPCFYTGRDMKTTHAGLGITKGDWDLTLKLFGETLAKFKVPEKEQTELAGTLAPLEKQIVDSGS
jgi:hemoglobin